MFNNNEKNLKKYDFIGFRTKVNSDIRKYIIELKEKYPEVYINDSEVIRSAISFLYRHRIKLEDKHFNSIMEGGD